MQGMSTTARPAILAFELGCLFRQSEATLLEGVSRIADTHHRIDLHITGERALDGIELVALDGFITHLLAALRDFDRYERGAETRKSGTPEAAAIASTAFRLVRLEAGSADATLVPIQQAEDLALPTGDPPRARIVFDKLLDAIQERRQLPREVATSLEGARKSCGQDGAFTVRTTGREVAITRATIAAVTPGDKDQAQVQAISGRLSRLAESPDQALIRSPDGTEWVCSYEASLAPRLQTLWRTPVRATGEGRRTGPRRGAFQLDEVEPLVDGTQTQFFSPEHIPTDVLLEDQGIVSAQGLDALGAEHLFDDELEDAYLAAVFGDENG